MYLEIQGKRPSRFRKRLYDNKLVPVNFPHNKNSKRIREAAHKQLKTFSIELIQTLGILQNSIRSNNWFANLIEIQVVADCHRSLLGSDLFPALGHSIQQSNISKTVN